ncbi:hypothetical protein [Sphingobacterium chuzhouense]|uniref:Uncharacterized protein n=1 Tax=Sphingobacterium chuzhouense TaxID=1742264 RepID=A0ABR7XV35_9SPHI|nr:hypothetical protein [Sphingobacterium chuzhouense]MBD1422907.1 hypothetical protein [Sphingobacterium chuzhouense]
MEHIEQLNYIKAPIAKVYKALTSEEGLKASMDKEIKSKARNRLYQ